MPQLTVIQGSALKCLGPQAEMPQMDLNMLKLIVSYPRILNLKVHVNMCVHVVLIATRGDVG